MPGSAHKEDLNFRYEAVGITDHLLTNDILYDLFVEMFKDCVVNGKLDDDDDEKKESQQSEPEQQSEQQQQKDKRTTVEIKNLVTLSQVTIKSSAGYLSPFIKKGYRHFFCIKLSGMMFHSRISEEAPLGYLPRCLQSFQTKNRKIDRLL